jgi:hypothetical protein
MDIEARRAVSHAPQNGRVFWAMAVPGWAVMAYGVWGMFAHASRTVPRSFAAWFLGALVVHDAVIAPLVIGVGALFARRRGRARRALGAGAIASAMIVAASLPTLAGFGHSAGNPSLLPNSMIESVGAVVGIGTIVAVAAYIGARRRLSS